MGLYLNIYISFFFGLQKKARFHILAHAPICGGIRYVCMIWNLYDACTNVSCVTFVWSEMCATRVQTSPVLRLNDLRCVRRAYKRLLCYVCMIWDVCDARTSVTQETFVWSEMCATRVQTSPVVNKRIIQPPSGGHKTHKLLFIAMWQLV